MQKMGEVPVDCSLTFCKAADCTKFYLVSVSCLEILDGKRGVAPRSVSGGSLCQIGTPEERRCIYIRPFAH